MNIYYKLYYYFTQSNWGPSKAASSTGAQATKGYFYILFLINLMMKIEHEEDKSIYIFYYFLYLKLLYVN